MMTQPSRLLAAVAVTRLLRVSSCMPGQDWPRCLHSFPSSEMSLLKLCHPVQMPKALQAIVKAAGVHSLTSGP